MATHQKRKRIRRVTLSNLPRGTAEREREYPLTLNSEESIPLVESPRWIFCRSISSLLARNSRYTTRWVGREKGGKVKNNPGNKGKVWDYLWGVWWLGEGHAHLLTVERRLNTHTHACPLFFPRLCWWRRHWEEELKTSLGTQRKRERCMAAAEAAKEETPRHHNQSLGQPFLWTGVRLMDHSLVGEKVQRGDVPQSATAEC